LGYNGQDKGILQKVNNQRESDDFPPLSLFVSEDERGSPKIMNKLLTNNKNYE
jgi:hypothetical protein